MKKIIITITALLSIAACDPCRATYEIHHERCAAGIEESCEWIADHFDPTSAMCY